MLVASVAGQLAVASTTGRASREREWNIVTCIGASYAVLSIRICSSQPPRCDPAKDCPARIQEDNVRQHDGEEQLEGAFLLWDGAEISREQCRVWRKVQRLREIRGVFGDTIDRAAALIGED